MRLRVIATNHARTIARVGMIDASVQSAIANVRKRGALVVIVTLRCLSELRSVAECLAFIDGVVAEDGAVIALPNGHVTSHGASPPLCLIEGLNLTDHRPHV